MGVWERIESKLAVVLLLQGLDDVPLILDLVDRVSHLLLHQQLALVLDLSQLIDLISDVLDLLPLLLERRDPLIKLPLLVLLGLVTVLKH